MFSNELKGGDDEKRMKVLVVGDPKVGKSSITQRLIKDKFIGDYVPTVGLDLFFKSVQMEDRCITFEIWDSPGSSHFQPIIKTFYKGISGVILVFSVDNRESFENIERFWINNNVNLYAPSPICSLLVGNKIDCSRRAVSTKEGESLARFYNLPYYETTAKAGTGINEAYYCLFKDIKETFLT